MHRIQNLKVPTMDNLHYRRTFDLDNKNQISGKNLLKVVKFQNLVENVVVCGKYSLTKFSSFLIIVLHVEIGTTFNSKMVTISTCNTMIRKFANFISLYLLYFTTFLCYNYSF